jgi:hypothetical protein
MTSPPVSKLLRAQIEMCLPCRPLPLPSFAPSIIPADTIIRLWSPKSRYARTQIEDLYRCTMNFQSTRDSREGCEINLWDFRMRARELRHQSWLDDHWWWLTGERKVHQTCLSNWRESNKANRRYTSPSDIETKTRAASASSRGWYKLTAQLCELGFELTKMVARRLILLGYKESLCDDSRKTRVHTFGLFKKRLAYADIIPKISLPFHLQFPVK